jgi:hypothetical protein
MLITKGHNKELSSLFYPFSINSQQKTTMVIFLYQVKKVKIENNKEKTQCTKKVHEQTKNVYFICSPL